MQEVDEKPETIHLYVVREETKRPYTAVPLFFACLCLVGMLALTMYSAEHPYVAHKTLRIPAVFLPLKTFATSVKITPSGVKTYPATTARGILTITNGSIISQIIPQGFTIKGVVTDSSVFVPAGSANGYGYTSVSAHALISGKNGNIPAHAIDHVEGSSIYIRNLAAFRGGRNSYSVRFETKQDRQTAIDHAKGILAAQVFRRQLILASPCQESSQKKNGAFGLVWVCQYVTYTVPSYMKVTSVKLVGKTLFVDVVFVPRPRMLVFK